MDVDSVLPSSGRSIQDNPTQHVAFNLVSLHDIPCPPSEEAANSLNQGFAAERGITRGGFQISEVCFRDVILTSNNVDVTGIFKTSSPDFPGLTESGGQLRMPLPTRLKRAGFPVYYLTEQSHMHATVFEMSNKFFYDGKITTKSKPAAEWALPPFRDNILRQAAGYPADQILTEQQRRLH